MTDAQIFAFLVMPFLLVLSFSIVFFGTDRGREAKPDIPRSGQAKGHPGRHPKPKKKRAGR